MANLEEILSNLLVPDNNIIQQATKQLKVSIKDPSIVPSLCQVLISAKNPQVRQYAAVFLNRYIKKSKVWYSIPIDVSNSIRQNILQLLLRETDYSVTKSIAQLIGRISQHDLPKNQWPELTNFLQNYAQSTDQQHLQISLYIMKAIGMFVLKSVSNVAATELQPQLSSFIFICSKALDNSENIQTSFYAIQTLTSFVPIAGSDNLHSFRQLVPKVIEAIRKLILVDEERAIEALEIFDELIESEIAIIVPHLKAVISFCLEISAEKSLGAALRVKSLSFISWNVKLKRKSILKHKLIEPILGVIFPIMCEASEDDEEDEDYEDESGASSPQSSAAQVADMMALNLPPEKFIPPLMKFVEPALISTDANFRKAGYIGMAVTVEGCANHIRSKYLKIMLQCVYQGLSDASLVVRNASLFALGQFSIHLQPDISQFSSELLPLLFDYVGKATSNVDTGSRGVTRAYYALEMFCENLGKEILPFLDLLMRHLLSALQSQATTHTKELAISAIGATANAAEDLMVPYFGDIINILKGYLVCSDSEENLKLQIQSVETLSVLTRTIGAENFMPLAYECIELAAKLLSEATDPDLKRCLYGLFASLSSLLKEKIEPYLDGIVKHLVDSLTSTEGVVTHYSEEESKLMQFFDESLEEPEDETEQDQIEGYSVENAFLDEKEDACTSIGEIALNTGPPFHKHVGDTFKIIVGLLDYPAPNVRKASVTCIERLCHTVVNTYKQSLLEDIKRDLIGMLSTTLQLYLRMIKEDKDREVVIETLSSLKSFIEHQDKLLLEIDSSVCGAILDSVKAIMQQKTNCQDEEELEDENEQIAELDGVLVENAGDLVPATCKLVGGDRFKPYFAGVLPELLKRTKTSCSVSDRSFSVGTIAETLSSMTGSEYPASIFIPHIYPVLIQLLKDSDSEVRSNTVFALGVLIENGGPSVLPKYSEILEAIFMLINAESPGCVTDNICGAVCRMISANPSAVPLEKILPVLLEYLPLHTDMEENNIVYKTIAFLYDSNSTQILQLLPKFLHVFSVVLGDKRVSQEIKNLIVCLLRNINAQFNESFQSAFVQCAPESQNILQTSLTTLNGN